MRHVGDHQTMNYEKPRLTRPPLKPNSWKKFLEALKTRHNRGINQTTGIAGFCLIVGLVFYPIFISPYLNPEPWRNLQKSTREHLDKESIQPGGMRVWSDPFGKK